MLLLCLDTSTPAVTAAVVDVDGSGVRTVAERSEVDARRHGELLAPAVEAVLADAGVGAARLAAVAVGAGPGPFTGLRVGMVTAATMSDALGLPVYTACSLDLLAVAHAGPVVAVTDARRREVYWASYDEDGQRRHGPAVERPATLADRLRGLGATPRLVGAGAVLHAESFAGLDVDRSDPLPHAAALAPLVTERVLAGAPSDPLTPLYLRRPDAQPPAGRKPVTAR